MKRMLWCLAVLLGGVYAAQAFPPRAEARPAFEDIWREHDRRMAQLRKRFFGEDPLPYFGDFDPFKDFQVPVKPVLPAWDEDDGLKPEISETDKEVIVALKVPRREGESLKVDVDQDAIRLSRETRTATSSSRTVRVMPIPRGADPGKNRLLEENGTLKIVFERRPAPRDPGPRA